MDRVLPRLREISGNNRAYHFGQTSNQQVSQPGWEIDDMPSWLCLLFPAKETATKVVSTREIRTSGDVGTLLCHLIIGAFVCLLLELCEVLLVAFIAISSNLEWPLWHCDVSWVKIEKVEAHCKYEATHGIEFQLIKLKINFLKCFMGPIHSQFVHGTGQWWAQWRRKNVKRARNKTVGRRTSPRAARFPGKIGTSPPSCHRTYSCLCATRWMGRRWGVSIGIGGFWEPGRSSSFSCRMVRSHHKQPQVILCGGTCPDNKPFFVAV